MPAIATPTAPPLHIPAEASTTPLDLLLPDGSSFQARVSQVRDRVAEVEVPASSGPVMAVGLVAQASVSVAGLGRPLPAHVRVLWRVSQAAGTHRYGLSLPALGQRGGAMTAALCAAFNRRACQRVRPEPLSHPLVTLASSDGRRARGSMNDISLGGLSLQVAADVELEFAVIDDVEVCVHLPNVESPVRLSARIRSRHLCGTRVRYGVEFEAASGSRSAVLDYVLARRQDSLRRAKRTAAPEELF